MSHKQKAVSHARRVNRIVIEHKKAGRVTEAGNCADVRNLWMAEARNG